jgi:hypothetical protein
MKRRATDGREDGEKDEEGKETWKRRTGGKEE